jgi:hypothetical protein
MSSDASVGTSLDYGYFSFGHTQDNDTGLILINNLQMKFDISSRFMVGSDGLTSISGHTWSEEAKDEHSSEYEFYYSPLVETTASLISIGVDRNTLDQSGDYTDADVYYSVLYNIDADPKQTAASEITIDSGNDASFVIYYSSNEKQEMKSRYVQYSDGVGWQESIENAMQDSVNYALSSSLTTANLMNFKKSKARSIDTSKVSTFENKKRGTESITAAATMIATSTDGGGY